MDSTKKIKKIFLFASELKAFDSLNEFDNLINKEALSKYLNMVMYQLHSVFIQTYQN